MDGGGSEVLWEGPGRETPVSAGIMEVSLEEVMFQERVAVLQVSG